MKFFIYITLFFVALNVTSCKQDQYFLYNDSARIQFGPDPSRIYTASYNLADTLKPYTFYYEDASVLEDTVYFDIYAIGGVSDVDRTFTLEQEMVSDGDNAVAGKHYVAFSNPKVNQLFVIKKGTVHTKVPIILLRDPSLKTSTQVLKFKVADDRNFKVGEINNLWRKVIFTDRLSKPAAWDASATRYYYGDYSVVKHQFMIESTGEKWDQDFMVSLPSEYALLQYWTGTLKINLVNYNNTHPGNPLRDEYNNLVVFP